MRQLPRPASRETLRRNFVFALVGLGLLLSGVVSYAVGIGSGARGEVVAGGVVLIGTTAIWLIDCRDRDRDGDEG